MKTIELFKVKAYEAYTADEQNTRWFTEMPSDNIDYKYELVEKKTFALPEELGEDETFVLHTEKDGRPFIETIDAVYYLEEVKEFYVIASQEYEMNHPDMFVMDEQGNYYGVTLHSYPIWSDFPKDPGFWATAEGSDSDRCFQIEKVWLPVYKVELFDNLTKKAIENRLAFPVFRLYPVRRDYKSEKEYKMAEDKWWEEHTEWAKKNDMAGFIRRERELDQERTKLFCSFSEKVYNGIRYHYDIKEVVK